MAESPAPSGAPSPRLELANLGAREAAGRIRRGELSAEAYAQALIAHQDAHSDLNTVITLDRDRVLADARQVDQRRAAGEDLGPLAGTPFVVKDQMDIAGYPTTAGNLHLTRYVAGATATVAQRLIQAGGVMLAKTNCGDMMGGAYLISHGTNSNPFFGTARNPYDRSRIPAGSSGGAGAAIAAGISPIGLGEDTAGSIRAPAAVNGIVGFRPSTFSLERALGHKALKRYPDDGMVPPAQTFDTWGPMARSAADVAFLDALIVGQAAEPVAVAGLRIGIPHPSFWEGAVIEPGVLGAVLQAFDALRAAGADLVHIDFQALLDLDQGYRLAWAVGMTSEIPAWLAAHLPGTTLEDLAAFQRDRGLPDLDLLSALPSAFPEPEEARRTVEAALAAQRDLFSANALTVLAYPTLPVTASPIREEGDMPGQTIQVAGRDVPQLATMASYTAVGARLGAPCLSLPAGMAQGLPVGLHLHGLPGADRSVLAAACAIEGVLGPLPAPPARGG